LPPLSPTIGPRNPSDPIHISLNAPRKFASQEAIIPSNGPTGWLSASWSVLDDETKRRSTLTQINRAEGRHSLGRDVFHGKRGEMRQKYREGQEDQLGALGLVLNAIVLWNTLYMDAALTQLRAEGHPVREEDVARLSPLGFKHINFLGHYSFYVPDCIARGELRPLRDPSEAA